MTALVLALASLAACHAQPPSTPIGAHPLTATPAIQPVDISSPAGPVAAGSAVERAAAKNEWTSFVLELRNVATDAASPLKLRIEEPRLINAAGGSGEQIALSNVCVYQVLPMPVNTNTAGYVRNTGLAAGARQLPRALLPLDSDGGVVNISQLRDPSRPSDPSARASAQEPLLLWIDLHVPPQAQAGQYLGHCDLVATGQKAAVASMPFSLQVYDFAIPPERHLLMVGRIDWADLERAYPDRFEAITPRLMNRTDATFAAPLAALDQLTRLAQAHRANAVVPRLQPTVKWPSGQVPQVDWSDFDSVLAPWLGGDAFADKTALGYWPLPEIDYLDNFDAKARQAYWSAAASHFNQQDWLMRAPAFLESPPGHGPGGAAAAQCCADAQRILLAHPLVRVMLTLEDDQLCFADAAHPQWLDANASDRLVCAASGLVFAAPTHPWPSQLKPPGHWLRPGAAGLVPYLGAGAAECDVRLWAWLAFLKHANLLLWDDPLPRQNGPAEQADPGELVWFYPGQWFGVDQPVPTVQLKWLRRAGQDYEYLYLAAQRGMSTNALLLARLMTKQVQLQPGQAPDPLYALLSGTVNPQTWDQAQSLLARTILLRAPGQSPDDPAEKSREIALNLDTIRWQRPQERPFLLPRSAQWLWESASASPSHHEAFLRLGVDIYNAGDNRPTRNLLGWSSAGPGWEFSPQPMVIGSLQTYAVQRFSLEARVDPDKIVSGWRRPLEFTFVDGYTRSQYRGQAVLPVAASDRREGHLVIDGKLDDWDQTDQLHAGRLTKMLDRPTVQRWRIEPASADSQIYSGWGEQNFYVAFRVRGAGGQAPRRNFIDTQFRRAWGEDLCQVLIQPIFANNTTGPVTYLACKPNGVCIAQRRLQDQPQDAWQDIDGPAPRYAADLANDAWTGELAIPWKLLKTNPEVPKLLRFNFVQHRAADGESASWAGPIDFDKDDSLMGLLFLRQANTPGVEQTAP